jgi:ubiquinone biosynthesis protein
MASLLSTVRDLDRLRQITLVLARHGFGEVVHRVGLSSLSGGQRPDPKASERTFAQRIRLVLEELGPCFVKLGQLASTRPDLVPESIRQELRRLQDAVPPVPFAELRPQLEAELGAPVDALFASLDESPLASASIGQVHRATLRLDDGEVDDGGAGKEVVVKLQRPGIKELVERDVDLLYWLARGIERSFPESRLYSPVRLVREFDRAISAELDFAREADNAERFARNFEGWDRIRFPRVHRSRSSKRALTLEYLPGRKIHEAIAAGASGATIASMSVEIVVKMIFEDGFFHADPHPGNVLILGDPDRPVIGLIDLGLVGRLTPKLRDRTVDLMVAAVRRDTAALTEALYAIGRPTRKVDKAAFEAEVTVLSEKYLGRRLGEIQLGSLVRDLVDVASRYGIEVPPDFFLVGKALMTLEGVGREIHPELDVFEEVKPFFLKLLWQRFTPERMGPDVFRGLVKLGGAASEMPLQVREILEDIRTGALQLQVHPMAVRESADRLGRRLANGIVVSALLLAAAILAREDDLLLAGVSVAAALVVGTFHAIGNAWRALRSSGRD